MWQIVHIYNADQYDIYCKLEFYFYGRLNKMTQSMLTKKLPDVVNVCVRQRFLICFITYGF